MSCNPNTSTVRMPCYSQENNATINALMLFDMYEIGKHCKYDI